MRNPVARIAGQSLGERRKFLAHLVTGVLAAMLALIVVMRVDPTAVLERPLSWYERWILLSGFLGGWAGVWIARDRLGRRSAGDALIGLVLMTATGAIIGGTLALPLYGTMFGPFTIAVIFAASPLVAGLWLANGVAVHVLMRSWHAERDSIFGAARPQPLRTVLRRLVSWRPGQRLNP